jgi:uncharacterized protein YndB with AHSA1/START domain
MSQKNKIQLKAEANSLETVITRNFDVPRELVFRALCDGSAIPKWWGDQCTVQKYDTQTGGSWSMMVKNPNGWEQHFHGVYHDVTAPERIVRTIEMSPGKVNLEIFLLTENGTGTTMSLQTLYQNVEDRDTVLKYGLEAYAGMVYQRLEDLLMAELQTA